MNCDSAQQGILLNYTGELATEQHLALEDHLKGCADCRRYRKEVSCIIDLAQKDLPSAGPSHEAVESIMAAGRRAVAAKPVFLFSFKSTLRLATAAGFLILAAGISLLIVGIERRSAAAHGLRMSQMSTIMTMVSDEETPAPEAIFPGNSKQNVRALARQILQVEGLTGDELADEEGPISEDDALPRDLQSHSTFDSRQEECV